MGNLKELGARYGVQYGEDFVELLGRSYKTLNVTDRTVLRWMLEGDNRYDQPPNCWRY